MKKIFSFLIFSLCVIVASAQIAVEKPSFLDNTYISTTVGADAQVHDWDFNGSTAGLRVGKMIVPEFGVEVVGQARFNDFYKQINSHRVGLNALVNINGLFFDGKRDVVEFSPFVGAGWQRNYSASKHFAPNTNDMYTVMGVYVDINVNKHMSVIIAPQLAYVLTGPKIQYNINRADLGVSIGAAYRIGDYFKVSDKVYTEAEWDALNAQVNKLRAANEALANREPEIRIDTVEVVKEVKTLIFANVGFEHNSSKILPTNLLTIQTIADYMKTTDCNYTIYGYASVEGPKELNDKLSQNRANSVLNALVEAGVPSDRLKAVGMGSTSQFGDKYELNRTIIIE